MTVDNLVSQTWRSKRISLEAWKAQCEASSHHHTDETISYHESRDGVISASSIINKDRSVHLGCYFTKACTGVPAERGWTHE